MKRFLYSAFKIGEIINSLLVIVFRGRKLGFEINDGKKLKNEEHFMTAVEFSMEYPYGKAIALFNLKSAIIELLLIFLIFQNQISEEESLVVPMIIMAFLVSESSSNYGKSCNNEGKGGGEAITNGIKDSPPDGEDEVKSSNCGGCGGGCGVSCGGSCGGHCSGGGTYRN
ncbi:glycine-rich domain-containing protein 2 [Gossypium australe]|uniref:Glycine-rich domain-containing protein 2 n=1 Tax=Gossypium australe TaxID=47621 RepID=A0A5B6W5I8_9ROSI|nr:glycine-rich domain-containing protein 2 [Gossypium australe]